jgi:hypothetical protein
MKIHGTALATSFETNTEPNDLGPLPKRATLTPVLAKMARKGSRLQYDNRSREKDGDWENVHEISSNDGEFDDLVIESPRSR